MTTFPFSAIVGQDRLRLALLLNVIDPGIGGVLLSGKRGTAKSTAVRALAALLPPITGISGCPYFCDPDAPHAQCSQCAALPPTTRAARTIHRQQRLVTLPLNASADRILGTLDLEATLHPSIGAGSCPPSCPGPHAIFPSSQDTSPNPVSPSPLRGGGRGERSGQGGGLPRAVAGLQNKTALGPGSLPGLLAAANRGLLYVDEINLLTDDIADLLLDVLASGVNRVERDGISLQHPARCALIASMNPDEGSLRPQLLDRFGLFVAIEPLRRLDDRVLIAERRLAYDADPIAFQAEWAEAEAMLAAQLEATRELLPAVTISPALRRTIAVLTTQVLDAQGHRPDIVTARTARAIAAWACVRAGSTPAVQPPQVTLSDIEQALDLTMPHRARARNDWRRMLNQVVEEHLAAGSPTLTPAELAVIEDYDPEPDAGETPGAAGITRRIRGDMLTHDLGVTIPIQRDRQVRTESGRRFRSLTARHSGRTVRAIPIHPVTDPAIEATLRAAAPWQRERGWQPGEPVRLERGDLRQRVRERQARALLVLLVDGSDSVMARNLMAATKRALHALLQDAYEHRDRVALLVFRFAQARLVLPPTRNIALARQHVEHLHVGGCTPLAQGLLEAQRLIQIEQLRDPAVKPALVVLTDGEGNIDLSGNMRRDTPMRDALAVAADIAAMKIATMLIDTGPHFSPRAHAAGWGQLLAQQLAADHYILAPPGAAHALEAGPRRR
jgi:magnesium chelatase subunit D